MSIDGIRIVDAPILSRYRKLLAYCIIVTITGQIYLQKHALDCPHLPGAVHPFGGHVEKGESLLEAMAREVAEETGGIVRMSDVNLLASMTEDETGHQDLVTVWCWRDREGTVTGCYEREPALYDTLDEALADRMLMPYARQSLMLMQNG